MPRLFGDTILRALDANGDPVSGARLRLFLPGTTTPIGAFTDPALTTPHATPIVANSSGVFPQVYITGNAAKVTMTTADDAGLPGSPVDNVPVLFGAMGSGLSVRDFGATGDGVADDTAAFVAAAAAGPVVYAPAGKYRLTDQLVLEGVTIVGDGWDFRPMLVTDADDLMGTWIICGFETATASSLIHLKRGGKLRDLGLYYPNQTATRPDAWVPTTTPWAITGGSFTDTNRTVRQTHSGAERICILEFTHGIRLTTGGERGVWREVYGNPFTVGLQADANYDVTRFVDFHFWPFGGNTGIWQENEKKYVLNNGVAFRFGRVDGLLMRGCFEIGYNTACEFYPSEAPDTFAGGATTNFHITDCYFDGCITAIKNSGAYASGRFVSGIILNTTMQHYNNADAATVITTTRHPTVDIRSDFDQIKMSNVTFTAGQFIRPGSHVVIGSGVTRGILAVNGGSCTEWDEDADGDEAFVAPASGPLIKLAEFDFKAQNNLIYTGAKARRAGNVRDDTPYDYVFTASLEAATPGDWSAVYGVREGRIRVRDGWFDFWLRLVVTPTFTTASGAITITGLPITFATTNEFSIAQFSGLTLPVGRTVASARVSGSAVSLFASGDASSLTTAALTSGVQAEILITGGGRV